MFLTDCNARPVGSQRVNTKKWGGGQNKLAATLFKDREGHVGTVNDRDVIGALKCEKSGE
jgi:hypothetical protein